jgi:hypothetical protein
MSISANTGRETSVFGSTRLAENIEDLRPVELKLLPLLLDL